MRYFIYPSGVNGRGLADTISLLEPKSECVLIDDATMQNLDFLAQNIQPDDLVLVASHNYFQQCTKKLHARGITCYVGGIEWVGEKLNAKIKNLRAKNKKAIGLVYSSVGTLNEENFCNLDEDLKARGYEIFYFVFTKEEYQKYHLRYASHCILAPHKILETIKVVDLMIQACGTPVNQEIVCIDITHGFQGLGALPAFRDDYKETDWEFLHYALKRQKYVVCGAKKIHRVYEKYFQKHHIPCQILDLGYMKLDKYYNAYCALLEKSHFKQEVIVFGFAKIKATPNLIKAIELLLQKGKKVFIASHPLWKEGIFEIFSYFENEKNFLQPSYFKNRYEMFARALVWVSDYSSTGWTFPLTTGKRAIIWTENKEEFQKECIEGEHYYFDESIHRLVCNGEELLQAIDEAQKNALEYEEMIKQYREQECFNFGKTKKNLITFIENLLKNEGK